MIELGAVDAGGAGPFWSQLDGGADSASETFAKYLVLLIFVIVVFALALFLALALPIDEEELMPELASSSPAKPTPSNNFNTPEDELPFPGKLIDGKYDVQYLHL